MEPTQVLLATVVTILTGLLVFVGVQVFFILRDVQKTIKKANKILDDAGIVSDTVVKPIVGVASFVEGLKGIKGIVDLLHDKAVPSKKVERKAKELLPVEYEVLAEEDERPTESSHVHTHISALQERGRRFFHRGGKPLTS